MVIIGASLDELTDVAIIITLIITVIISTGVMKGRLGWPARSLCRPYTIIALSTS
jgi:hypothetical protein